MKTFNTPANHTSPIDRQSELLLKIKEQGSASISDLATHFEVSEMTIRRMIHRLADAGLVIRTPGGAMAAPAGSMERTSLKLREDGWSQRRSVPSSPPARPSLHRGCE